MNIIIIIAFISGSMAHSITYAQDIHKITKYGCTATNLPVSNNTKIVLNFSMLLTVFIIKKHDGQKKDIFSTFPAVCRAPPNSA